MTLHPIARKTIALITLSAILIVSCISCAPFGSSSSKNGRSNEIVSVAHSKIPFEITSTIKLDGKKLHYDKKYVSMVGNVAMITEGGTYCIEGYLEDGQIRVYALDKDITLILNGVDINCMNMAPIYIESANSASVYIPESSVNVITCAEIGTYESALEAATYAPGSTSDEAGDSSSSSASLAVTKKGALVSECNLTISGNGVLSVFGYLRNGIHSRDSLYLSDVVLNVTTTNNGIKATNNISITSGQYDLVTVGDAVQADGDLTIDGGTFNITTGQGSASVEKKTQSMPGFKDMNGQKEPPADAASENSGERPMRPGADSKDSGAPPAPPSDAAFGDSGDRPDMPSNAAFGESGDRPDMPQDSAADSSSASDSSKKSDGVSRKALKAKNTLTIGDASITIDSADDALHSDGDMNLKGGTIEISSSDDAIHADDTLSITGSIVNITDCCEGLEGAIIDISGGEVSVTSTDDGLNASSKKIEPYISISGGSLYVNSEGDGLDSNMNITISGGEVYVDGPSNDGNASIDVGSEDGGIFVINGGTLTATGMSDMLEVADESSKQQSLTYVFDEALEKGSIVTITDSQSNLVAQITLIKNADSIIYSSSDLVLGETYTFTCEDVEGSLTASSVNATNHEHGMGRGPGH